MIYCNAMEQAIAVEHNTIIGLHGILAKIVNEEVRNNTLPRHKINAVTHRRSI